MPLSDQSERNALLLRAGIDPELAAAVMEIDGLMQKWRRRAMRREIGQGALKHLSIDLDLPQFDVIAAIGAPQDGDEGKGEVMVATVAERLNIDPSRASRLVSEVVDKGYARRAVSQADARRTIIELTERGADVLGAVNVYKSLVMGDFLAGWDPQEISTFIPLLQRFSSWMDGLDTATEKYSGDIEALARSLAKTGAEKEPA
jgi:DNA-binding MarR family transcriptional regulator